MPSERSKTSITIILVLLLGALIFLFVPVVVGGGTGFTFQYAMAEDNESDAGSGWGEQRIAFSEGILGPGISTPCTYIEGVYNFSMEIIGIITFLVILIGGVIYVASWGKPETIQKAKEIIVGAITGLILALISWLIFNTVAPYLTICKDVVPEGMIWDAPPGGGIGDICTGRNKYDTKEECEESEDKCDAESKPCSKSEVDKEPSDDDSGGDLEGGDDSTGDDDGTEASLIEAAKAEDELPGDDDSTGDDGGGETEINWCCISEEIDMIYVHWSAGNPQSAPGPYHYEVTADGVVHNPHSPDDSKCACTRYRNTGSISTSVAGARYFKPRCWKDSGDIYGSQCREPFTEAAITGLKSITSTKASEYGAGVMTHSQSADEDGYHCMNDTNPDCRWDFWLFNF